MVVTEQEQAGPRSRTTTPSAPPSPEVRSDSATAKSRTGTQSPEDLDSPQTDKVNSDCDNGLVVLDLTEVTRIFKEGPSVVSSSPSKDQTEKDGHTSSSHEDSDVNGNSNTEDHIGSLKETTLCSDTESRQSPEDTRQNIVSPDLNKDELNDAKAHLSDASRRIHEMEIEIKRLENEREELSVAYKEAETLRRQEEAKAQRLTSELTSVRHDYERRITAKEEELESLKKQMSIEIDQLSQRLAEAEAKVKTEVARIKKKMQVQITELEMSLDVSNKQNIDMQKTIKTQSTRIMELQSAYDEVTRQLQQTIDNLGVTQRRLQALTAELEELRVTLEQTLRAKRVTEQQLEESHTKISELNTINVNLTSVKGKLENEYIVLQNDYEEISKELRVSDERYNRVIVELKSTKDLLVEEQERVTKIESIKKSLEVEVRNLQIRIEEVEVNALAGGRRVVSKLESRIRDIEVELEEEKRRHSETQKIMRKKEHRVKELLLQTEEDHKTITMLNDAVEKLTEKVKMYKRQLAEQEGMTQQNLTRVRRFQRELEAAEDRADQAESNLSFIRSRHRTIVTSPGSVKQVFVTTTTEESASSSQY